MGGATLTASLEEAQSRDQDARPDHGDDDASEVKSGDAAPTEQ